LSKFSPPPALFPVAKIYGEAKASIKLCELSINVNHDPFPGYKSTRIELSLYYSPYWSTWILLSGIPVSHMTIKKAILNLFLIRKLQIRLPRK
jgi:hypothetical protein